MDGPALFQANLLSSGRQSDRASGFTSYNPSSLPPLRPSVRPRPSDALVSSALIIFAFAACRPSHPIPSHCHPAEVGTRQRAASPC